MPATETLPSSELPPAVPTVLFDRELGARLTDINFNYQAFYDLAKDNGFSDEQINDYTIHFSADKPNRPGYPGKYFIRRKTAEICVDNLIDSDALDKVLAGIASRAEAKALSKEEFKSRVLSRTVAHETGHHSAKGRSAAKLAYAGLIGKLATPLTILGAASTYSAETGNLWPVMGTMFFETLALAGLGYKLERTYGDGFIRPANRAKIARIHERKYSEQPAYKLQEIGKDVALVTLKLKTPEKAAV